MKDHGNLPANSVEWMVTNWWLKCEWKSPFPSSISRNSATIQSPNSRLKGGISSCVSKVTCRWCVAPCYIYRNKGIRKISKSVVYAPKYIYNTRCCLYLFKNKYDDGFSTSPTEEFSFFHRGALKCNLKHFSRITKDNYNLNVSWSL